MALIAVFAAALLVAVLLSGLAARSVFSTSLLFLLAGAAVGPGLFGLVHFDEHSPVVVATADVALFGVLFTDGMHAALPRMRQAWRHPARALGIGLPLAWLGVAVLAKLLIGLDWVSALLLGAVLAPTDPVFASAIVVRRDVPLRLRSLLNVESGLNDGLALPVVLVLIALARPGGTGAGGSIALVVAELAAGVALGVAVPFAVSRVLRLPALGIEPRLQPLGPVAVAVGLYALCHYTHANSYLAAFFAGATIASLSPSTAEVFEPLGEQVSELLKFAAVLVFGGLLTPDLLARVPAGGWVIALLSLVLIRPASLALSLLRSGLPRRELLAAAWFGPKGFASVVYGLLVVQSGIAEASQIFAIVAVTIAVSIAAHSTTDVPVARLFDVEDIADVPSDAERATQRR